MHRRIWIVACSILLAACSGGERETDRAIEEGVLLIGNGTEPKTIDPQIASGVPERNIISALFEGLVITDPKGSEAVLPGVAQSWEHDDEARVWTFHLRPGARWSNGDRVTAQDFAYGWRRALTPALGFELVETLYVIKGAEAFNLGKSGWDGVGVATPDSRTLVVTLANPTPQFLQMLTFYAFNPVHRATIEANGGIADRSGRWLAPGTLVGNGPFVLTKWQTNQLIEVRKNAQYWDAESVALNAIRFFPIENETTEEKSFLSGRLHLTSTVPANKLPGYADDPRFRADPLAGTYFYSINLSRKPLNDRRVREALSLAIDRRAIVERVTQGGQTPAGGLVPLAFKDYRQVPGPAPDPERARALLAEAGFPGGKGFPRFEILINTSEGHRKIAEAIQAMWRRELGIDVGIYNQEWKVYLDTRQNRDFTIARMGWVAPYLDPLPMLEVMTTGNPNNDSGYSSPQFDALIDRSRSAGDKTARYRLMEQADRILARDLPIIPIYWYTEPRLIDPRLKGWDPQPRGVHPYKFLSFED
ncbi:peptide ABC transporter substrate-binding protein [Croceicoccus naphthovorans]|uniref:peptide ABC transporter substrate-binding protein n=1 Tax=Croceicoccus naphthovorans TaxID=1348774 RepID=UPI001C86DE74|nr:peptide ABC transporter substrate-binding protein [Croceicoccus naphthovorans]